MEIENTQEAETVDTHQESGVLGSWDIDVVIEELDDKNKNTDERNVNGKENESETNEGVEDVEAKGVKEVENADRDEDTVGDSTDIMVDYSVEIQGNEDTGRDSANEMVDDSVEIQGNENTGRDSPDEMVEDSVEVQGNEDTGRDSPNEMVDVSVEVQFKKDKEDDNTEVLQGRQNGIDMKAEEAEPVENEKIEVPVADKKRYDGFTEEKQIPVADENKENAGASEPNNNSIQKSISLFGAPVKKKEKGMFKVVQTEKCAACQKTVYAMEKLEMNGHIYHKNCFKCSHCSARLTPKTFSMNEGVIYCVNHFKQLFARKGNYDEGFGRQQYKKKWQGDKPEGATA